MSEKSNMVKKETLIYALLIGFVAGFIGGAIFAVYKLTPSTPQAATKTQSQSQTAITAEQLSNQQAESIATLEVEVTARPENLAAWTQLGHLYYDTDQAEKAIKAYTRSLELQPGNADVLTDMGVMYRRNKQPDKAIESFEKAYTVNPKHEPSRLNKGIVLLYDYNKPEEAIATWEELLLVNPETKLNNGTPLTQAIAEIRKKIQSTTPKE